MNKGQIFRASLWSFGGFGLSQGVRLANNLILTRLLFPDAFGLMALVHVFVEGLGMFSDIGSKSAIIQSERGDDPAFLNTAWTIQIIRGLLIWAAAALLAWPISQIYGQPILFGLLCTVGATAAISGFQSISNATVRRRLVLGRVTLIGLIGQVTAMLVTIGLAWIYESVWVLAIGRVLEAVVVMILGHVMLPRHRHAFKIEPAAFHAQRRFGQWIMLSTIVTFVGGQGIRAIQGWLVSPATLGYIAVAGTFAWAMGDLTNRFIGTVVFPRMSMTIREKSGRFNDEFRWLRNRLLALTLPVFILLSFVSTKMIHVLYDTRYALAGTYLSIMAINGAISVLPMMYTNSYIAFGNTRTPLILNVISTTARISGLIVGFHVAGVEGMLFGVGAGSLFHYGAVAIVARKDGRLFPLTDAMALGSIVLAASVAWRITLR